MRLLLCALSLPVLVAAQPVIRVTTRLVDVSVIVRDGKGPVADLLKDDFTVFDNGVERPLAFFAVNSTRPPAKRLAPQPPNVFTNRADSREDAPIRLTAFVIDALNTEFESQARIRQQFLRYVREIGPRDRAAVWVMTDKLRRVQDFTHDAKQLTAAVEHAPPNVWLVPERPAAASLRAPSNEGEVIASAAGKTAEEMMQYYRMQLTNDLLRDLAASLARIPGRKNLVWLSAAFPLNMSIGPGGPETSYVEGRLSGTGRALAKGNVALYPVDARGLQAPAGGQPAMAVSASERHRHDSMDLLAAVTGGRAIYDTNDIAGAIREAVDDASVTYTIGFYPGPGGEDGGYHRLQIETKRRGVQLRYRDGYIAADPRITTQELDGSEEIRNALSSPLDALGIAITARLEQPDPKRPGWARMTIAAPAGNLTDGDLVVSQRAADGRDLLTFRDEVRSDGRPRSDTVLGDSVLLRRQVQLAPGVSRIRIVVYDRASGRIGSLDLPGPPAK